VNFDRSNGYFPKSSIGANVDRSDSRERNQVVHSEIDVEGYNEGGFTRISLAISRA
jgi:GTP cyclohydrolase I